MFCRKCSKSYRFSVLFFLCLVFAGNVRAQKTPAGSYVPDELLVKFVHGSVSESTAKVNQAVGSTPLESLGDLGWQRVRIPAGLSVKEALEQYKNFGAVEAVQPNFYYSLLKTPNDPQFTSGGMYGLTKIGAPAAWDITTGSSAVVVADLDTGLRYTHEDIAPNVWTNPGEIPNNGIDDDGNGFIDDYYGYDFYFNDSDPIDIDNGKSGAHGTHTAGTIGAAGNNALGIVGINWNVKIMAIKIFNNNESGDTTTSAMLVNAYNYIRMMKNRGVNIRVTNNSYGGCSEACGYDQATKDGIDALGNVGIINIFAAGNASNNNDASPSYPASYTSPSIIAVAASDSNDNRASFSSYGATSVDLAAPGVSILSTVPTGYGIFSGTSMATPHVAGAAALLSAFNPNLSVASIKASLLNNVDVLDNWNGVVKTGGRLNVFKAMQNPTLCDFTAGSGAIRVPTKGGVFTVDVRASPNCDYLVASSLNWVHILTSDQMSGPGTITFRVSVNPTVKRSGIISIGGQTFTVGQSRN